MSKTGKGIPPYGVSRRAFRGKKPSGHTPLQHKGIFYSFHCPNRACKHHHSRWSSQHDNSIRVGVKPPKACPACGTAVDPRGYVTQ